MKIHCLESTFLVANAGSTLTVLQLRQFVHWCDCPTDAEGEGRCWESYLLWSYFPSKLFTVILCTSYTTKVQNSLQSEHSFSSPPHLLQHTMFPSYVKTTSSSLHSQVMWYLPLCYPAFSSPQPTWFPNSIKQTPFPLAQHSQLSWSLPWAILSALPLNQPLFQPIRFNPGL